MTARRPWTGWFRSETAHHHHRRGPRLVNGEATKSTSSTLRATVDLPSRSSAPCVSSTAPVAVFARSGVLSHSQKPSGGRPCDTMCRGSPSSTRWIGRADFARVLKEMEDKLGARPVPIQLPIGAEDRFEGIIDLIAMEKVTFSGKHGETAIREPIPAPLASGGKPRTRTSRRALRGPRTIESQKRFSPDRPVEKETLMEVLRSGTIAGKIQPVLCGSALRDRGVLPLLDAIVDFLPSPEDIPPVAASCPPRKSPSSAP